MDSKDNIYAAELSDGMWMITKRDPSGAVIKRFGYGEIQFNLMGLAVDATGNVYGSEKTSALPPPATGLSKFSGRTTAPSLVLGLHPR